MNQSVHVCVHACLCGGVRHGARPSFALCHHLRGSTNVCVVWLYVRVRVRVRACVRVGKGKNFESLQALSVKIVQK